jgi:hypothetical protein
MTPPLGLILSDDKELIAPSPTFYSLPKVVSYLIYSASFPFLSIAANWEEFCTNWFLSYATGYGPVCLVSKVKCDWEPLFAEPGLAYYLSSLLPLNWYWTPLFFSYLAFFCIRQPFWIFAEIELGNSCGSLFSLTVFVYFFSPYSLSYWSFKAFSKEKALFFNFFSLSMSSFFFLRASSYAFFILSLSIWSYNSFSSCYYLKRSFLAGVISWCEPSFESCELISTILSISLS